MTYPNADESIYTICAGCTKTSPKHVFRTLFLESWTGYKVRGLKMKRMTPVYRCPVCKTTRNDTTQSGLIDSEV